jgi:hypothetical protein
MASLNFSLYSETVVYCAFTIEVRGRQREREREREKERELDIVLSLIFVSENHNPQQQKRDFYNTELFQMNFCTQRSVKFPS